MDYSTHEKEISQLEPKSKSTMSVIRLTTMSVVKLTTRVVIRPIVRSVIESVTSRPNFSSGTL